MTYRLVPLYVLAIGAMVSGSPPGYAQNTGGAGRQYKQATHCGGTEIDPLDLFRVGFTVTLAPNAVACRTPEAYEAWLKDVTTSDHRVLRGLDEMGVCFRAPERPLPLKILQIIEAPSGGCDVELIRADGSDQRSGWTDLTMIRSVR